MLRDARAAPGRSLAAMSSLGDLLEAMHEAPRASTLVGRARVWRDSTKIHEAIRRINEGGGNTSITLIATASRADAADDDVVAEDPEWSTARFWWSGDQWRLDMHESI